MPQSDKMTKSQEHPCFWHCYICYTCYTSLKADDSDKVTRRVVRKTRPEESPTMVYNVGTTIPFVSTLKMEDLSFHKAKYSVSLLLT